MKAFFHLLLWLLPAIAGGQPCNNATELICGAPPVSGTTIGGTGNFVAGAYSDCVLFFPGVFDAPDRLYKFTLTRPAEVTIRLEILTPNAGLNLFLMASCQPPACLSRGVAAGNLRSVTMKLEAQEYYVIVDGFNGAQGDFMLSLNCVEQTTVCDYGGTFISRSISYSGSLDASDIAPTSLMGHPQVINTYGGSQNIPNPLYADIYTYYDDGNQMDIGYFNPNVKLFVFACRHCAQDAPPSIGTCTQSSDCVTEEYFWQSNLTSSIKKNPCSRFFYIVLTGALGATYSNLQIVPSWNCKASPNDSIVCGKVISTVFQSTAQQLDSDDPGYKRCYNGFRKYKGPEKYYQLVLSQPNKVTFNLSADAPMGMFLYSFMCGNNCLGYAENTASDANATLTATLSEGIYYLALDTEENGGTPNFTVSMNCEQYSPFVDEATFLSGNFSNCATDGAAVHQVNVNYNPTLAPSDYLNFYFRNTDGALKGNTNASKYWHNAAQPLPFYLQADLSGDGQKCSYSAGDTMFVFIHQTENGKRTFRRFTPEFVQNNGGIFQAGAFSQISGLTANATVNFNVETNSLSVRPDSITIPFPLTTNLKWAIEKVDNAAPWLTIDPAASSGPETVTLRFEPNISPLPRSVVLRFYAVDQPDLYRQFVRVEQQGRCVIPQPVSIVPSAATVCLGSSLSLTADVGAAYQDLYSYLWSTGEKEPSIVVTPKSAGQNGYSVTVTNKHCFITDTEYKEITASEASSLETEIGLLSPVKCFGGSDGVLSVSGTGSVPPFTYNWSNGATSQINSGLPAGVYFATVTDGAGCQDVNMYILGEPPAIVLANSIITHAVNGLNNGAVEVEMTGGTPAYNYKWQLANGTPLSGQTGNVLQNVPAGEYQVKVVDANGCVFFSEIFKVENILSVSSDPELAARISVFPNPTTGLLYLRFDLPEHREAGIRVYDLVGREMLAAAPGKVQSDLLEFDLSDLNSGLYLLRINVEGAIVNRTFSLKN